MCKLFLVKRINTINVNEKDLNREKFITKNSNSYFLVQVDFQVNLKGEFEAVSHPPTKISIAIKERA